MNLDHGVEEYFGAAHVVKNKAGVRDAAAVEGETSDGMGEEEVWSR